MSHSFRYDNTFYICDGDPRGGEVRIRNMEPGSDLILSEIVVPYDDMASFVISLARHRASSKIRAYSWGAAPVSFDYEADRVRIRSYDPGTDVVLRSMDVPFDDLAGMVAEQVRRQLISKLEQTADQSILDGTWVKD